MRFVSTLVASVVLALGATAAAVGTSVLFIGNSFTYGANSAVQFYRADTVTDLNSEGIGGVPALFKSFTAQDRDWVLRFEPNSDVLLTDAGTLKAWKPELSKEVDFPELLASQEKLAQQMLVPDPP